ncbi:hypothetical protein BDK51DRAFT_48525 [Blyttiomyces helicus]|uniref:Uncharacterized protein n=1 Tax=Blyttiomyces helicus TaxID=388810 RepID=A0A4P9W4K4_9FUNG|nr:hypothetical protein BDK51DRAFT_48525 [Blyttiomyces helicus]|eukprot:RKO86185.1 hypothetical protein BDK51DRAFT_48525 [Blyttiomyces helicus]
MNVAAPAILPRVVALVGKATALGRSDALHAIYMVTAAKDPEVSSLVVEQKLISSLTYIMDVAFNSGQLAAFDKGLSILRNVLEAESPSGPIKGSKQQHKLQSRPHKGSIATLDTAAVQIRKSKLLRTIYSAIAKFSSTGVDDMEEDVYAGDSDDDDNGPFIRRAVNAGSLTSAVARAARSLLMDWFPEYYNDSRRIDEKKATQAAQCGRGAEDAAFGALAAGMAGMGRGL